MTIVRKIVAVTVTAAALAAGIGVVQAQAAPLAGSVVVQPMGGGQGNWPFAK